MNDDRPLSEIYRTAAKRWCELDSAATMLEECKTATLSQRMLALGEMPVSKAEMLVKGSEEWRDFITKMVDARSAANLAKVKLRWIEMKFSEQQSAEATARSERRL